MDVRYEEKGDIKNEADLWRRWKSELDSAERAQESYFRECDKILELYSARSAKDKYRSFTDKTKTRYNVFWSNIETLKPATYSKEPKPIVSRRHQGKDPVARVASMIQERVLKYNNEEINIQINALLPCRNDYLLFARAVPWVRFSPEIVKEQLQVQNPETGEVELEESERIVNARVDVDHVNLKDIKFSPCREWPELRWGSRKAYMTRDALKARFGDDIGKRVNLTYTGKHHDEDEGGDYGVFARGVVEEIWDRDSKSVYWVSPGLPEEFLDVKKDPLRLKGFFPFPRPAFGTLGDSIIPTPDYVLYRDLVRDLNVIWQRITNLESAMKWSGCYNGQYPELRQALTGPEDNFIPVADWGGFLTTAGGIGGGVQFVPYKEVVEVIARLYDAGRQKEEAIYKVTGISDIIRGYGDPGETATGVRTKGEAAGLRIRDRQEEMARLVRDTYAIEAEIIAEWFPEEILLEQAAVSELSPEDQQFIAPAMELLRNDMKRGFKVEIETDATVEIDRDAEKQRRMEFADAITNMMGKLIPLAKQAPETSHVVSEVIGYVSRGMGAGRELEGALDVMLGGMQQPQQPPQGEEQQGPDPAQVAAQQAEQMNAQVKQQESAMKAQAAQAKLTLDAEKAQDESRFKREKLEAESQIEIRDQNIKAYLKEQELKRDADIEALRTGAQVFPLPFQP